MSNLSFNKLYEWSLGLMVFLMIVTPSLIGIGILLFFAIPEDLSIGAEFQGVLLFVILGSCLIMAWSLIAHKNKLLKIKEDEEAALLENEEGEKEVISEEENIGIH